MRFVRELKDAAGSKVAGMCCDIFCSNCPYTAGYAACWTKYGTLINITATFHIILLALEQFTYCGVEDPSPPLHFFSRPYPSPLSLPSFLFLFPMPSNPSLPCPFSPLLTHPSPTLRGRPPTSPPRFRHLRKTCCKLTRVDGPTR